MRGAWNVLALQEVVKNERKVFCGGILNLSGKSVSFSHLEEVLNQSLYENCFDIMITRLILFNISKRFSN